MTLETRPSLILARSLPVVQNLARKYEPRGLKDLRVYGSAARCDDRLESDIDFLISVDLAKAVSPVADIMELRKKLQQVLKPAKTGLAVEELMYPCVLREIHKDAKHILPECGRVFEILPEPASYNKDAVLANRTAVRIVRCMDIAENLSEEMFFENFADVWGAMLDDIASYGFSPEPPDRNLRRIRAAVKNWIEEAMNAHPDIAKRVRECASFMPKIKKFRREMESIERDNDNSYKINIAKD